VVSRALDSRGCVFEARHNYRRKVAELAVQHFITNNVVNVKGLILAGSAQFKEEIATSALLDPRLQQKAIKILDIAHGGNQGLQQAIQLSADVISSQKIISEQKTLQLFFDEIVKTDRTLYCFGASEVLQALEASAVETLILYEKLPIHRHELVSDGKTYVIFTPTPELDVENEQVRNLRGRFEIVSSGPLQDYLIENYRRFGAKVEIVTDVTTLGSQFVKGFGGLGAILRYELVFSNDEESDNIGGEFADADNDNRNGEQFVQDMDAFGVDSSHSNSNSNRTSA